MLRFLADENLNNDIISGLIHRCPEIDLVRVQDIPELFHGDDPSILEWAADRGRIVITHDISTMTRFAIERIEAELSMPGIFAVPTWLPVGEAIEDLRLLATCSLDDEWRGQTLYLPLK